MSVFIKFTLFYVLTASFMSASANELQLGLDIPTCKMPSGKPLPEKYYALAKKWKKFSWVLEVQPGVLVANGSGLERIDGSEMFNWYTFGKLDINGDGVCDWFLTSLAPYSSGGDSGVLNTLYLGKSSGWARVGATVPTNMPDALGWGGSQKEQADFAFSSDTPLVLWDQKNHTPYLIGWFGSRDISGRQDQEGYHLYTWSPRLNTLQELDKWEPGSVAAQVYEYFKQHGAVDPTKDKLSVDRVVKFDPDIEKSEFDLGCLDDSIKTKSRYFAHLCEAKSAR